MGICYWWSYGEDIVETFYEKELPKQVKKKIKIEKVIKKKMTNYFSNGKVMIIHLIVVLLKKILLYKKKKILFFLNHIPMLKTK